jgi:Uma2 family endonuclease
MQAEIKRRSISVKDYHQMAEAGIIGPDERVELIRGEIVLKMSMGDRRRGAVSRLNRLLTRYLDDIAVIQVQCPVELDDHSEPEPDFAVLFDNDAAAGERAALTSDVIAAIEVADSSRTTDFRVKVPLYAETGIREVWVVDLVRREIVVHRDPQDGTYRKRFIARPNDEVAFGAFPELSFGVAAILGAAASE